MKQCTTCGHDKAEGEFYLHRRGGTRRRSECKTCSRNRNSTRAYQLRHGIAEPRTAPELVGELKLCVKCHDEHDKSRFDHNPNNSDGLHSYCKACRSAENKAYVLGI